MCCPTEVFFMSSGLSILPLRHMDFWSSQDPFHFDVLKECSPSFLLQLLGFHCSHLNLESICNVSFILCHPVDPISLTSWRSSFPTGLRCPLSHRLSSREISKAFLLRNVSLSFSTALLSRVHHPTCPPKTDISFHLRCPTTPQNALWEESPVGCADWEHMQLAWCGQGSDPPPGSRPVKAAAVKELRWPAKGSVIASR